ncbi:MAG: DUF3472 domain-containing protein [Planctomycetaceae bacterium]
MSNRFCMLTACVVVAFCFRATGVGFSAEVRVPAFTAYTLPDPSAARVSEEHGITHWDDPAQTVNWYGRFKVAGAVEAKVVLHLEKGKDSRLTLTIGETTREVKVAGRGSESAVEADFGIFNVPNVGYQKIELKSLNPAGQTAGDIESLVLDGPATDGVHFNMKERRNAASVHLAYPVDRSAKVEAFYCEVTAVEEPVATFYMACGWHRGYFGMQVNSETERRIIFSVWDSGDEAVDRKKVVDENRVRLMGKGAGVYSGDFGNEGTGGHSHLKYMWKTGDKQKFIVTAEPVEKTFTIFSGYWFHPERNEWMLISSWKAPKEGGHLRGLHSFSENFGGQNGHLLRKARYGNQWVRTVDQKWLELTTATFSHDPTGKSDRFDRYMGVEEGQFFLSHGGFLDGYCDFGDKFDRPATGIAPADLKLPAIKE